MVTTKKSHTTFRMKGLTESDRALIREELDKTWGEVGESQPGRMALREELREWLALVDLGKTAPILNVNLNNYKYYGNPIMQEGAAGSWEAKGIQRAAVTRIGSSDWRMFYGGR